MWTCRTRSWSAVVGPWLALCAIQTAAPVRPAVAQQADSASEELIGAVLRYTFRHDGGNVRLLRGRVPDDLGSNYYVPPGTRVLGSVVMGSGVLVLATSTTPPESLRAEYLRALEPRGWKPMEMVARMGGFVETNPQMSIMLCRQGAQLVVASLRRSQAVSDLFLLYRDGSGPCDESRPVAFRGMAESPPFPTLFNPEAPPGSRAQCFPTGLGARGVTGTATRVAGQLSAEEILQHYARQIEAQGWRPSPTEGQPVVARTWTQTDTTGTRRLHLEVRDLEAPGRRCYDVRMDISGGTR